MAVDKARNTKYVHNIDGVARWILSALKCESKNDIVPSQLRAPLTLPMWLQGVCRLGFQRRHAIVVKRTRLLAVIVLEPHNHFLSAVIALPERRCSRLNKKKESVYGRRMAIT